MASPQISVLLPVFNGARYLEGAIASVLRQGLSSFELLIADDRSTDSSLPIIRGFSDGRIRCFERAQNMGLFRNLNLLLAEARAPLVRFLCQDDALMPDCLENEVEFFDRHPQVGMSYCKCLVVDERGEVIDRWALGDLPEVVSPSLSTQLFFYFGCIPGNLSTVCARKKCFEEVGMFSEAHYTSGDYEMWVRICRRYDLGVVHKHLLQLRRHTEQLSRSTQGGLAVISENRRIRSELLHALPASARFRARVYSRLRHDVLDVHHFVRCLLSGRLNDSSKVIRSMGLGHFTLALAPWLLTLNNRLYRPRARFIEAP